MNKRQYAQLILRFVLLVASALGLSSCTEFPNQAPVIRDIIYAREVPTSFDTILKCTFDEKGDVALRFKWFSDNGTIKGDGNITSFSWYGGPDYSVPLSTLSSFTYNYPVGQKYVKLVIKDAKGAVDVFITHIK